MERDISILAVVLRSKWTVLLFAIAVAILSAVACFVLKPTYQATAYILVRSDLGDGARADGALNREATVNSQVKLIESEDVIKSTVKTIKAHPDRVASLRNFRSEPNVVERFMKNVLSSRWPAANSFLTPSDASKDLDPQKADERALFRVINSRLGAKAELNSDLIRVDYRSNDSESASQVLNIILESFIEKNIRLYAKPRALAFFSDQLEKYKNEFETASRELNAFSGPNGIYSVQEQRNLLLARKSEVESKLAAIRSSIAEKEGQVTSMTKQLLQIRPVAMNSNATGLIGRLGRSETTQTDQGGSGPISQFSSDPPLLLIKVYQETMQSLVKVSSEEAGAKASQAELERAGAKIERELRYLSEREARFEQLRGEVDLANFNVQSTSKRIAQEKLEQDASAAKLSNVQIAQRAYEPQEPIFPKPVVIVPFGFIAGVIFGIGFVILRDAMRVGS